MQRLGRERKEVPHHGWRLEVGLRVAFLRMDEIAKLERILDEKDRRVVANHVPGAFFGVELDGKAARITLAVSGTLLAAYRRETNKQGRGLAGLFKELGGCPFRHVGIGADEASAGPRTLGVHDAFGDALTVEMRHLFKEKEVFEAYGAAGAGGERVLVIATRTSGVRCHRLAYFVSHAILQDVRSKGVSAGWKPNPLAQGESDRETVANKVMGRQQALTYCPMRESTP